MRRREFIAAIGGAVAAWPLATPAQADRIYKIGVLILGGAKNELGDRQRAVLKKTLTEFGWQENKNIQFEYRWGENDDARIQAFARELLTLQSDVILAEATRTVTAFQRETSTTPIVFVAVSDPVRSGVVASLARPGANITGFTNGEPTRHGKYVEILKEMTPGMTTVALLANPDNALGFLLELYEAAARYHGVEFVRALARDAPEIERVFLTLADKPTTGLIVAGDPLFVSGDNLALVVSLTRRHRVRAIYAFRHCVDAGGLISYGVDLVDQYRQAATYIDRILRGTKPSELPVQAPTRFEMVINSRTAREMGLAIPPKLLARADAVID
jgi:putative ABC transport system substrate-binding protein